MLVNPEILSRTIGSSPELIEGIKSGIYTIWGGVVRVSKGQNGAGSIVGHLQFPNDSQQASEAIARLQQMLGQGLENLQVSADTLQTSMNALQNLQVANLALSGLNLAVSVAGFAIVCKKLNKLDAKLDGLSNKLDELFDLAQEARQREVFRDLARFRATVNTALQFAEMDDIEHLKPLIKEFREQYELTKLLLEGSAGNSGRQSFIDSIDCQKVLHERLMYLGLFQSFVQHRIGAQKYAVNALQELKVDWLRINQTVVNSISSNHEWVTELTVDDSKKIISLLNYRKSVAPAIEYQTSLLELVGKRPESSNKLIQESSEILFLAA